MTKEDLIIKMLEDLDKRNTQEHNRVNDRLDKIAEKKSLTKAQLASVTAIVSTIITAIANIFLKG